MGKRTGAIKTLSAVELMPQDEQSLFILRQRAQVIATPKQNNTDNVAKIDYVRFRIGDNEQYGIPFSSCKEVLLKPFLTKVPTASDYIAGVINRRGMLTAVLNLAKLFRVATTSQETNSHIIFVSWHNITVGFMVDQIQGSDAYDPSNLDAPLPTSPGIKLEYITGLHHGIVAIMNVDVILRDLETNL